MPAPRGARRRHVRPVLGRNPEEPKDLVEVGAYSSLHGDRAKAEQMFSKSFAVEGDEVWSTLSAAGAYLDVKPQL